MMTKMIMIAIMMGEIYDDKDDDKEMEIIELIMTKIMMPKIMMSMIMIR